MVPSLFGGHFSGDNAELEADLAWHHDNYLDKMTFMENSLKKMTEIFARDSPKSSGRKRTLVLVSDGRLQDSMADLKPLHERACNIPSRMGSDVIMLLGPLASHRR